MATHKLSSNEVAALVGGLMDLDNESKGGDGEYRSYKFGSDDLALMGEFHALRMINDRFCRIARASFLPMLRIQPRISSFPPEIKSFDDYRDSQDNFISLSNAKIEQLRGNLLFAIPPSFISLLTDSYYGGSLRQVRNHRTEFTSTEQRVIEILTDSLVQALRLAWRDLMELSIQITSREENLQFAAFVDNDDMIVNCSFMVQLPDSEPASFDILYPLQMLKPISSQLRSRVQSDYVEDDKSWKSRLYEAVLSIPLPVTAELAHPRVSLTRLMQLKSDDVVPVTIPEKVRLKVADIDYYYAEAGEVGNNAALNIIEPITKHNK
ncbi:MAG: flagellar motor switch protein FliM [Marivivens sp.]|nr:flagellar motor switch protein FliM [Marivivens sp.]